MSIAGKINIFSADGSADPTTVKLTNFFVNIHNFLSSTCVPLGVVRRAFYKGVSGLGTGAGFADTVNSPGQAAFALFEFTKAAPPFWLLLQWDRGGGSGNGYPYQVDAGNQDAVSIAVGIRSDGGNPWNGTLGNSGSDSKGIPVWTTGSSPRLYVFPRSNNPGGTHNSSKENAVGIYMATNIDIGFMFSVSYDWLNMWATEESFCTAHEQSQLQVAFWSYFGKYTPIEGLNPEAPYFQWEYHGRSSNDTIFSSVDDFWQEDVGSGGEGMHHVGPQTGFLFEGSSSDGISWGGISNGGIAVAHTGSDSMVRKFAVGANYLIGGMDIADTNHGEGSGSLVYDEMPLYFFVNEPPHRTGSIGYIGTSGDLRFARFPGRGALSSDGTKISLKSYPRYGVYGTPEASYPSPYIILPWTGSVKPFFDMRKEGYDFYVP